ncbi:MAG: GTPase Era, partial [Actinomycetia bacterium]|nr:GTPase Era [Actinomycetes bacterium]
MFKSGFVGIIGRPNVGKSTLLNSIVGARISIVTSKPQTTRYKTRGIFTSKKGQIIFIDTPGYHKPQDNLGKFLNKAVLGTVKDIDVLIFIVDVFSGIGKGDEFISNTISGVEIPKILCLNKIDLLRDRKKLEEQLECSEILGTFNDIIPISALKKKNLKKLIKSVFKELPEGPRYYDEEELTDLPEHKILSEVIREKAFELLYEEVPYSVAVNIEDIKNRGDKEIVEVYAVIYVERESQKGILIGQKGSMLKEIG